MRRSPRVARLTCTTRMSLHDRNYARGAGGSEWRGGGGAGGDALRSVYNFLNWSFPIGRFFGIRVRVHIMFVLLVLVRIWPDAELLRIGISAGEQMLWSLRWIGLLFCSVLLHEFGHCFGCRAVGGQADEILMWPLGGLAFCAPPRRPWPEFVTVVCGPMVNVVLAGASYLALLGINGPARMPVSLNPFEMWSPLYWVHADSIALRLLADLFVVNHALLLFNVLMIFYPFDGGRLVQIGLWVWLGYQRSMLIATTLGMVGAVAVSVVGLLRGELLLVLIGVFGFITCIQQRRQLRYMEAAEPEFDPRFAAAYETQQGGRGAWFDGASGRTPRSNDRRSAKEARQLQAQRQRQAAEEAEIDRILDKVRASGMQSLSKREQAALRRATDRQRGG
jgi:stage IV sporulation protein FB